MGGQAPPQVGGDSNNSNLTPYRVFLYLSVLLLSYSEKVTSELTRFLIDCRSTFTLVFQTEFSINQLVIHEVHISKGAWLWKIAWVAWNRMLVGRMSLTLTRVALGRLLRVTLRRVPLLWKRLVVMLLRVTLCL